MEGSGHSVLYGYTSHFIQKLKKIAKSSVRIDGLLAKTFRMGKRRMFAGLAFVCVFVCFRT